MSADTPSRAQPLVTVVVPVHNGARFLAETLASVLAQTWSAVELVIVDDGSTDASPEIAAGFASRARLLRQVNGGVAAARNAGAAHARGAFVAFLDQDDVWEPDLLATLVPELERQPECALAYADSWLVDARGGIHGRRSSFMRPAQGEVFAELVPRNFVPVETALLRAETWRALGGFDPALRYLEDWELCLRAARRGPFAYVDRPLARYRVHARNLSHDIEPLLREGLELMKCVEERCAPLSEREQALVAVERTRLALDLAWKALRRRDLAAADVWRARAGAGAFKKKLRTSALRTALALLPESFGDVLLDALPERRLYGLRASDLTPGDELDP